MTIYQVGGSIRDAFLKRKTNDIDYVVVGTTIENMLELGFQQVGKHFPVFIHPDTRAEYALARVEKKVGIGHQGFTCFTKNVSLEQDLGRRDLTINTLAIPIGLPINNNTIIDPYNGLNDIKNKKLRHTNKDAFKEDPLRVLRVARFLAQLPEFTVAQETKELCRSMKEELKYISRERVVKEMFKALATRTPWRYFDFLDEIGVMGVVHPEIKGWNRLKQKYENFQTIDSFVLLDFYNIDLLSVAKYPKKLVNKYKAIKIIASGNLYNIANSKLVTELNKETHLTNYLYLLGYKSRYFRALAICLEIENNFKYPKNLKGASLGNWIKIKRYYRLVKSLRGYY